MPPVPLWVIASEKNWMAFAVQLEAAMAVPAAYELATPRDVRAHVGRLRNQLPSSLATALKAAQFLRERHPAVLAARDGRIGCAQVRTLARIAELSPDAAWELAPQVFRRSVRQRDLLARLAALQARAATPPLRPQEGFAGMQPGAGAPAAAPA